MIPGPKHQHQLVKQHSDPSRQVLSRQESGSSRGVPDPSASLDAIHPPDRTSPYTSDVEHGITSGSVSPIDPPSSQVIYFSLHYHLESLQKCKHCLWK